MLISHERKAAEEDAADRSRDERERGGIRGDALREGRRRSSSRASPPRREGRSSARTASTPCSCSTPRSTRQVAALGAGKVVDVPQVDRELRRSRRGACGLSSMSSRRRSARTRFESLALDVSIIDTDRRHGDRTSPRPRSSSPSEIGGLPALSHHHLLLHGEHVSGDRPRRRREGEGHARDASHLPRRAAGDPSRQVRRRRCSRGSLTALVSILGMYIGIRQSPEIPPEVLNAILGMLEPGSIAAAPLASLAVDDLLRGVASVALVLREVVQGSAEHHHAAHDLHHRSRVHRAHAGHVARREDGARSDTQRDRSRRRRSSRVRSMPALLAEVYASLVVLAALGMWMCTRVFNREDVIFRSA